MTIEVRVVKVWPRLEKIASLICTEQRDTMQSREPEQASVGLRMAMCSRLSTDVLGRSGQTQSRAAPDLPSVVHE